MQKSSQDTPVNQTQTEKIHAYLAHCGVASRRRAEELVSQGKVTINGIKAIIGQRINPENDIVAVDGKPLRNTVKSMYFLLHKPAGYVSTTNDELGRPTVLSLLPKALLKQVGRLYPVGRLDIDSEGLLLLTNDGALAQKLTHPSFEVTKTYHVQLDRQPSGKALSHLHRGVKLKDGLAMVDSIDPLHENHPIDQVWFSLTVHEGRNRLIRRLWERLGYDVKRLIRVSFGEFSLDQLRGKRWIQVEKSALEQTA